MQMCKVFCGFIRLFGNYGETGCPYHGRWVAETVVFMALFQIDTALLQIDRAFFADRWALLRIDRALLQMCRVFCGFIRLFGDYGETGCPYHVRWIVYSWLFCGFLGFFCGYMRLFCRLIGLF